MGTVVNQPSSGKIAWQQGALFGVILGVIGIIFSLISSYADWISYISWIVWIGGLFYVGFRAAQITGRVGTGALAGLWAGLIGGLISLIFSFILVFVFNPGIIDQAVKAAGANNTGAIPQDQLRTIAIVGVVVGFLIVALVQLGLGAGLGAIGGAVGKGRANVAPAGAYQEAPYPGQVPATTPEQNPYAGNAPQQPVQPEQRDAGNQSPL